jgi:hypothetical protein
MGRTTEHVARKARRCDEYPRCRHGIFPGQRYRRHVYFPGDESFEDAKGPIVLTVCAGCAAAGFRPLTGARVESFKLHFGDPVVVASGVITETVYRAGAVAEYVITDGQGVVHAVDPHRINVLEPVASEAHSGGDAE